MAGVWESCFKVSGYRVYRREFGWGLGFRGVGLRGFRVQG